MTMTEIEQQYIDRLERKIHTDGVTNDFLVSLLKLSETYLQLTRIKEYASQVNKSEQAIRRYDTNAIVKVCNYQLVINNE